MMNQNRRNWSDFFQEDKAILTLVKKYGTKNWAEISEKMSSKYGIDNRTGKQCRQRWHNHLDPEVNKDSWTDKEQKTMFQAHQKYGNKWTQIAKLFQGRTDNDIKNHFYSMLRRSLRRVNKLLGMTNSTQKIKVIKPSVLSKIFTNIGNEDEQKSQECKKIAQALFQFSKSKVIQDLQLNLIGEQKKRLEDLIQRLSGYNDDYEHSQLVKRQSRRSKHQDPPLDTTITKKKSLLVEKNNQKQDETKKEVSQSKGRKIIQKRGRKKKIIVKKEEKTIKIQSKNTQQSGPVTRLQHKISQQSLNMDDDFVFPDFQLPSFNDLEKKNSSFGELKKISSSMSSNPSYYFSSLSPKMDLKILTRTPQGPTPCLADIFTRNMGTPDFKPNNEQLDGVLNQIGRAISKKINK